MSFSIWRVSLAAVLLGTPLWAFGVWSGAWPFLPITFCAVVGFLSWMEVRKANQVWTGAWPVMPIIGRELPGKGQVWDTARVRKVATLLNCLTLEAGPLVADLMPLCEEASIVLQYHRGFHQVDPQVLDEAVAQLSPLFRPNSPASLEVFREANPVELAHFLVRWGTCRPMRVPWPLEWWMQRTHTLRMGVFCAAWVSELYLWCDNTIQIQLK